MRFWASSPFVALAVLCSVVASQPTAQLPTGATVTGRTKSAASGAAVDAYLGIPYADAPVGDKRWKQSTLKTPVGAVNATEYRAGCRGFARFDQEYLQFPQSEDCLFLNIFVPTGTPPTAKLPVMVWIHGGAFVTGTSAQYDATNLVGASNNSVIVVTLNFRLGVFGFISSKEILAEGDGANFGYRDQETAFHWIKRYIASFGGDPDDITAFGESMGGMSVAAHMIARNGTQQLFHKGILQSGVYTSAFETKTYAQSDAYFDILANGVGCSRDESDVMDCLRRADVDKVFAVAGRLDWRPTVDGIYLQDMPIKRVLAGKISRIPTIVGVTTDEGWLFSRGFKNASQFDSFLRTNYPLLTEAEYERAGELYPADQFISPHHRVSEIFGDITFLCPSELFSSKVAALPNVPTYRYRFNQPTSLEDGFAVSLHIGEIPYLFNQVGAYPDNEHEKKAMAKTQMYWLNFARSTDPNGRLGSPSLTTTWPKYDGLVQHQLLLEAETSLERVGAYQSDHEKRCEFWRGVDVRIADREPYY